MRRALVTGGNRGIGRAIAEGLVLEGLDVVIGVRDLAAGRTVAEEIGARAVALDLSDPAACDAGVEGVTVLVNNAGVLFEGAGLFDDMDQFEATMDVSLHGPYSLIRACLPAMRAAGYGRVVNVSSGWGSFAEGLGGPGAYGVGKAAMNALTLAASRAVPDFVKVNAMCPGLGGDPDGRRGRAVAPRGRRGHRDLACNPAR